MCLNCRKHAGGPTGFIPEVYPGHLALSQNPATPSQPPQMPSAWGLRQDCSCRFFDLTTATSVKVCGQVRYFGDLERKTHKTLALFRPRKVHSGNEYAGIERTCSSPHNGWLARSLDLLQVLFYILPTGGYPTRVIHTRPDPLRFLNQSLAIHPR